MDGVSELITSERTQQSTEQGRRGTPSSTGMQSSVCRTAMFCSSAESAGLIASLQHLWYTQHGGQAGRIRNLCAVRELWSPWDHKDYGETAHMTAVPQWTEPGSSVSVCSEGKERASNFTWRQSRRSAWSSTLWLLQSQSRAYGPQLVGTTAPVARVVRSTFQRVGPLRLQCNSGSRKTDTQKSTTRAGSSELIWTYRSPQGLMSSWCHVHCERLPRLEESQCYSPVWTARLRGLSVATHSPVRGKSSSLGKHYQH